MPLGLVAPDSLGSGNAEKQLEGVTPPLDTTGSENAALEVTVGPQHSLPRRAGRTGSSLHLDCRAGLCELCRPKGQQAELPTLTKVPRSMTSLLTWRGYKPRKSVAIVVLISFVWAQNQN